MGRLQTTTLVAVVAMCVAAAEATELVLAAFWSPVNVYMAFR